MMTGARIPDLIPAPPFRLDLTAWALRRRPDNEMDRFDGRVYSRIVMVGEKAIEVRASQPEKFGGLQIKAQSKGVKLSKSELIEIAATIERMFSLRLDLSGFYDIARKDGRLGHLAERFLGLKPPRFPTVFEAAVNGIACQQLSLEVGITLLNRLCKACGVLFQSKTGSTRYAFPRPHDILTVPLKDFRKMGFSNRKGEFLHNLAHGIVEGRFLIEGLGDFAREEAIQSLMSIRGIGRWTAEYILLRSVGDLSAFPGDDVGGRNKLSRWLGTNAPLSYEDVQTTTSRWKPFPGLIYFHLLLDELSRGGYIREGGLMPGNLRILA